MDAPLEFPPDDDPLGVTGPVGSRYNFQGNGLVFQPFPPLGQVGVHGDAAEPGAQAGLLAKPGQVFKGLEEGLLGEVVGLMRVVAQVVGQVVNMALVGPYHFLPGIRRQAAPASFMDCLHLDRPFQIVSPPLRVH